MPKDDWASWEDGKDEYALHHLVRRLYEAEGSRPDVTGAEVWVHSRRGTQWKIGGPHFDKDEQAFKKGHASGVAFPLRGTVTYLSSCGGPTVVYNQTLAGDGLDGLVPSVPEAAAVSWPVEGKHITFKGTAYHQIRNDRNLGLSAECGERVTLLVNWWDHKVASRSFTEEWAAEGGLAKKPAFPRSEPLRRVAAVQRVRMADVPPARRTRHVVPMYPTRERRGERQFLYTMPSAEGCGGAAGTCLVDWEGDAATAGGPPLLDQTNQFVGQDAFAPPADSEGAHALRLAVFVQADRLHEATALTGPIERELGLRSFIVEGAQSPGMLALFGVRRNEPATAAVFQGGHFLRLNEDLSMSSLRRLVKDFVRRSAAAGRIQRLGNPSAGTLTLEALRAATVRAAADVEGCAVRAAQRLMMTSRGTRTHCVYLLSGEHTLDAAAAADKTVAEAFRPVAKGLAGVDQTRLAKALDGLHVPKEMEGVLAEAMAPLAGWGRDALPAVRPLVVVADAEHRKPQVWSAESGVTLQAFLTRLDGMALD